MDEQHLSAMEKREIMADPESRKLLFWNSYEREYTLSVAFLVP